LNNITHDGAVTVPRTMYTGRAIVATIDTPCKIEPIIGVAGDAVGAPAPPGR